MHPKSVANHYDLCFDFIWFSEGEFAQVSGQENTIEGCKSLHFHHACRLPAKHEPAIQAESSEKRAGGRREEVLFEAALQRLDEESRHRESGRTKLNARREVEVTESKKRKKSRKFTLGNSTFYHA